MSETQSQEGRFGEPIQPETQPRKYYVGDVFREDNRNYKVAPGKQIADGLVGVDITALHKQATAEGNPQLPLPSIKAQSAADALVIQQATYHMARMGYEKHGATFEPGEVSKRELVEGLVSHALNPDSNGLVVPLKNNAKGKVFILAVDNAGKVVAFELTPKQPTRWQKTVAFLKRDIKSFFAKKPEPVKYEKKVETYKKSSGAVENLQSLVKALEAGERKS